MKIVSALRKIINREPPVSTGKLNKQARDAWLQKTLAAIPNGSRILDAGAGELGNKPFCSHLVYVSQDFGQFKGGDNTAPGLGSKDTWDTSNIDIVCDITHIPEPDASFDAILCSEVFEHIPDPIAALRELARLLRLGGKLILTAPFNSLTHQAPYFFQTGYSRFFYEHWCQDCGLQILELTQNGNYFEYLAQEIRRLPSVGKDYAGHPITYRQKMSINNLLSYLDACTKQNQGSEELLCFGYHLLAQKV